MKQFFKELFCWHDYSDHKVFVSLGGVNFAHLKCRKCGKVMK